MTPDSHIRLAFSSAWFGKTSSYLFDELRSSAARWQWKARELLHGAKVLMKAQTDSHNEVFGDNGADTENMDTFRSLSLGSAEAMLLALAFENLIKGVLAERHGPLDLSSQGKLQFGCKPHDLMALVRKAELEPSLSSEQLSLIDVLSHVLDWSSRYPIPKGEESVGKSQQWLQDHIQDRWAKQSPPPTPVASVSWQYTWDFVLSTFERIADECRHDVEAEI